MEPVIDQQEKPKSKESPARKTHRRNTLKNWLKALAKKAVAIFTHGLWWMQYLKLRCGFNALRDIKVLSIEFSSVCNLRCKYCFIEQNDRARFLDVLIYEKLIKEVAEDRRYRIQTIEWPSSGEFFVYPHFKQIVEITKKYIDANPHFRPHIILNDNLTLFNEKRVELILNSGIVKQVICSVDGHDAKSFEDMRPLAKFDKVLANFRRLVQRNRELGHPVWIQINNGRDEQSENQPLSDELREIFRSGDDVTFWQPKFWNDSFNKKTKQFFPEKGFCSFVFNDVGLSASGFIGKCGMDLKGATVYADLAKESLANIWHSQVRQQFLTLMFQNRRSAIPGCENCSIAYTNNDNRFNNIFRKIKRRFFRPIV